MIPTSIDGTDITGATIDGTDVTEITVDGQTVFSAAGVVGLSNLVAWYRMEGNANDETVNQPTSADTTDYGGTQNGGSFVSSDVTDVITGTTGQAYEFTGNQDIIYPYSDPPAFSTICAWVYIIDKSDDFAIFTNFDSTGSDVSIIFSDSSNNISLGIDNGGFVEFSNPSTGEWYHVVVTITNSNLEMFIDGTSEDTDIHSLGSIDNGQNYQTGETPSGSFDGNGRVDDIRLYNTVLNQPQIQSIYDSTKPSSKP